jgi:hypothetical protein
MALARVVTFEGVDADRMAAMQSEMEGQEAPDDVPASEVLVLHDPQAEKSVVMFIFENEADYTTGDAALNAMDPGETPGRRTSVTKYNVAMRMTATPSA